MQLSHRYEDEKAALKKQIFELNEKLNRLTEAGTSRAAFIKAIRSFLKVQKLTPTLLRELIDRIDVHAVKGKGKSRTQEIVIDYRFIGVIDVPYVQHRRVVFETRQGVAIEYVPKGTSTTA